MPYKDPQQQKQAQSKHYAANKEAYAKSSKKRREAYRAFLLEYLTDHPCVDCGETDPIVLEFDHRNPSDKSFNIGEFSAHRSGIDKLKLEIAKCDVRCANCHRRRTAKQFGWLNKTPPV